jgi:hypothetical protein
MNFSIIANKVFNQKQVKVKRWEDPSNQKTTIAPQKKKALIDCMKL